MKKNVIYGIIAFIFVGIAAFILFGTIKPQEDTPVIALPSPNSGNAFGIGDSAGNSAEVTTETVQSVIKTLSRATSYSRLFSVKTYYTGGEKEERINQWQKDENVRISFEWSGTVKNILIKDGKVSTWFDDSADVKTVELGENTDPSKDMFSRLLTYEELLDSPTEDILAAGYESLHGEPCIYAEYKGNSDSYVNRIYISIKSGLVYKAQIFENESLIYSMEAITTELSSPSDDVFSLPSTKKA